MPFLVWNWQVLLNINCMGIRWLMFLQFHPSSSVHQNKVPESVVEKQLDSLEFVLYFYKQLTWPRHWWYLPICSCLCLLTFSNLPEFQVNKRWYQLPTLYTMHTSIQNTFQMRFGDLDIWLDNPAIQYWVVSCYVT